MRTWWMIVLVTSGCAEQQTAPPAPPTTPTATTPAVATKPPFVATMSTPAEPRVAPLPPPLGTPDPFATPFLGPPISGDPSIAIEAIKAALVADQAGDLEGCVKNNRIVIERADKARSRLHLASCERRLGRLVAARADIASAFEQSKVPQDEAAQALARKRGAEVDDQLALLTAHFRQLSVAIDGVALIDGRPMIADPGAHTVVSLLDDGRTQTKSFELPAHTSTSIDVDAKGSITIATNPR